MTAIPSFKEDVAPWGLLTSLDIYGCDRDIIMAADKIRAYVVELCDLIAMKRFGDCQVVHFGNEERVEGYSMIQLIETSLISGHFANHSCAAYIDIFSCKPYDPKKVADFSMAFYQGRHMEIHITERR